MCVDSIEMWHRRARPTPGAAELRVQLGCHLEEVVEMLDVTDCLNSVGGYAEELLFDAHAALLNLSRALKTDDEILVHIQDRKEFLDSLGDQVVTAVGVGHCAGMKTADAVTAVNSSNWSKYDVNGKPIFDANGKIAKGPNYHKPVLDGMY